MTTYTFQSLFDFTRTTSGTFVGSNGLIQTTPASVNLLTFTQELDNAAWTNGSITIGANITAAPDGTNTADKLQENTTSVSQFFARQTYTSFVAGTYTMSFYAKAAERTWTYFELGNTYANVNLSTGAVGSTGQFGSGWTFVSASATSVGNGWYRCSIVATCTIAGSYPGIKAHISTSNNGFVYAGTIGSGIFVWGAQLETGSTATDYTRNNGGVYPARFDYDPATLAPKGILIEEQRVNLLTYSEQFDNAVWVKSVNGTGALPAVTNNATTAPDGTVTADAVTFNRGAGNTSGDASRFQPVAVTGLTSGASHTFSMYVKAVTAGDVGKQIFARLFGLGSIIVTLTAEWQRITFTQTAPAVSSNIEIGNRGTVSADNTVSVYLWGAQLEAGSFATSYIPTVASQVTRTADACSIVSPMFAPWFNATEGTFAIEADVLAVSLQTVFNANDGSGVNRIAHFAGNTAAQYTVTASSVDQALLQPGTISTNVVYKFASAYAANNFAASLAGGAAATDTSGSVPIGLNKLSIGVSAAGTAGFLNGHIRNVKFFPVRLADFQLQAITA